ncbi:hypothetical protein [Cellulosilyticum sp. I15G10I2]|uniref:hypothetical protein n=1 Tax=Cellulosilyticum sp. I15G10I2 TaxID=1892843 RepID=UPI00085CC069|nr:hypothetical protein [Cellulosilyticum sp. I15G10I2]
MLDAFLAFGLVYTYWNAHNQNNKILKIIMFISHLLCTPIFLELIIAINFEVSMLLILIILGVIGMQYIIFEVSVYVINKKVTGRMSNLKDLICDDKKCAVTMVIAILTMFYTVSSYITVDKLQGLGFLLIMPLAVNLFFAAIIDYIKSS